MFNPHIHQQQQQIHQHLRQLQQLFQQQPPPPPPQPPSGHHVIHQHHQTPRAIPVPLQTPPPPRMVNLCQTTQTTIIAPNPMLQGAILMQQMQGNMPNFGMGGQQFRQIYTAASRSSLLGPVPMGMAIKSPIMGFPAARPFPPHARYYNTTTGPPSSSSSTTTTTDTTLTTARQPDRKQNNEPIGSSADQQASSSTSEPTEKFETDTNDSVERVNTPTRTSEEHLEEPAVKKRRTERSETSNIISVEKDAFNPDNYSNTSQLEGSVTVGGGSSGESYVVAMPQETRADEVNSCSSALATSDKLNDDDQQVNILSEEMPQEKYDCLGSPGNQDKVEEGIVEGANKFYCYLCSITCHNQQNFRSHMNSISHQQRMMEIQHMSNACLVTLLPRVQETLQEVNKDRAIKADLKYWCAACQTHFTSSIIDHRCTEKPKLASRTAISSCMVCKKHFKTSQILVEHLQSQDHKQKLEMVENEDCEALVKLSAVGTDGFLLGEEDDSEDEDEEERHRNEEDQEFPKKQDCWSFQKEVTLKSMASDEQYNPDKVYGSRFFVPVTGFICRLCNRFYHFDSSAQDTHCKSLTHFENLKRYKTLLGGKSEAVQSSRESLIATENTTHWAEENSFSSDIGLLTNCNSKQPKTTLTPEKAQRENQQHAKESESNLNLQDVSTNLATCTGSTHQDLHFHCKNEETMLTTSQTLILQESPAKQSVDSRGSWQPDAKLASTAEDVNEREAEREPSAVPGKKKGTGKTKATPKRRSGRAINTQ